MELIGQGSFSKVYKKSSKHVLIKSCDPVKECMAHGWFPNSRLFPKVHFGEHQNEYTMRYYPKVRALKKHMKPKDYELYKTLKKFWNDSMFIRMDMNDYISAFKSLPIRRSARQALVGAVEALGNYGNDMCFEIPKANVTITENGSLILLDCFFMRYKLREVWSVN